MIGINNFSFTVVVTGLTGLTHARAKHCCVTRTLFSPDNVRLRHLDCKGGKVALHARRDEEGTGCGVEARHKLSVAHLLLQNLVLIIPVWKEAGMDGPILNTAKAAASTALMDLRILAIQPLPAPPSSPAMVVDALAQQFHRALRIVLVNKWQAHIIHEEDELTAARRAKAHACRAAMHEQRSMLTKLAVPSDASCPCCSPPLFYS